MNRNQGKGAAPAAPPYKLPTSRSMEVLAFLGGFIARESMPPTVREICDHFGWSSENAAQSHLLRLMGLGLIERRYPNRYGIRLTPEGHHLLIRERRRTIATGRRVVPK